MPRSDIDMAKNIIDFPYRMNNFHRSVNENV